MFPAKTTFNDIISEEIEFITDNRRWENLKDMVKEQRNSHYIEGLPHYSKVFRLCVKKYNLKNISILYIILRYGFYRTVGYFHTVERNRTTFEEEIYRRTYRK